MNKAIFLDRDGTIIKDKGYAFDPKSIEFIDGVVPALRKLQREGYLLIIVTNQSGVARGMFSEEDVQAFDNELLSRLRGEGVAVNAIYYCPHHPQGTVAKYAINCDCRKPKTKLFWDAVRDYQIDLSQSYAIGDKERDCAICFCSECKGCLIGDFDSDKYLDTPVRVFRSFADCADAILKE